jgi:16S rRNA (guanine527-N7)-methyltransferase
MHPGVELRLLESNSRKVTFLKHVIRLLQLKGVYVSQGRIEAPREWHQGEGYGVITARALADLRRIILWCAPLLEEGGFLVAFLGVEGESIVEKNKDLLTRQALTVEKNFSYLLPGKKSKRHTFIFKKQGPGRIRPLP